MSSLAAASACSDFPEPASPFNNAAAARRVTAPVLLVHGRRDELVGPWQAERLAALCRAAVPPLYLDECGHFDVERHPTFLPRLAHFLAHETRRGALAEPETSG